MSSREMCPWCGRPLATDDDWENIPEGEGEHLCWAHPYHTAECCDEDPEDIVRALRAKVEKLEEVVRAARAMREWQGYRQKRDGIHAEVLVVRELIMEFDKAYAALGDADERRP